MNQESFQLSVGSRGIARSRNFDLCSRFWPEAIPNPSVSASVPVLLRTPLPPCPYPPTPPHSSLRSFAFSSSIPPFTYGGRRQRAEKGPGMKLFAFSPSILNKRLQLRRAKKGNWKANPPRCCASSCQGGRQAHAALGRREPHGISAISRLALQLVLPSSVARSTRREDEVARQLIPPPTSSANHLCVVFSRARHTYETRARQRLPLRRATIDCSYRRLCRAGTDASMPSPGKGQRAQF